MSTESSSQVLGLVTQWLRAPRAAPRVIMGSHDVRQREWEKLLACILAAEKSTWTGKEGVQHRLHLQKCQIQDMKDSLHQHETLIRRMRRNIQNRAPDLFYDMGLDDWNQDYLDRESSSSGGWDSETGEMSEDSDE